MAFCLDKNMSADVKQTLMEVLAESRCHKNMEVEVVEAWRGVDTQSFL